MAKWSSIYQGPDAPCKDCTRSYIGCHGKCEEYIAYQEDRKAAKNKRHRDQAISEVTYWAQARTQSPRRRMN